LTGGVVQQPEKKVRRMAIQIKNAPVIFLEKIIQIAKNETIMNTSPFFMKWSDELGEVRIKLS
jgi:hypothetical protein